MIRLLEERAKAGIAIRVIGRLTARIPGVDARKQPQMRLHTRTMIVDGRTAFIGSQSLREMELDARREVGIVFKDSKVLSSLMKVFEDDWALTEQSAPNAVDDKPISKVAKRVAKAVARDMPPVMPVLDGVVKELVGEKAELDLNAGEVEAMVKVAVKAAVKEAVQSVVEGVVAQDEGRASEAIFVRWHSSAVISWLLRSRSGCAIAGFGESRFAASPGFSQTRDRLRWAAQDRRLGSACSEANQIFRGNCPL